MTYLQPDAPQNGGRIVSQNRTTQVGPGNVVERGIEVSFQTAKGVTSSVFIPDARYTPDNVVAAVKAAAAQLDAVQGMSF